MRLARTGDTITADLPLHSDGNDRYGLSATDTGRTTLYRNGKKVGENTDPGQGAVDVPPPCQLASQRTAPRHRDAPMLRV
jgi:hypothetical protein